MRGRLGGGAPWDWPCAPSTDTWGGRGDAAALTRAHREAPIDSADSALDVYTGTPRPRAMTPGHAGAGCTMQSRPAPASRPNDAGAARSATPTWLAAREWRCVRAACAMLQDMGAARPAHGPDWLRHGLSRSKSPGPRQSNSSWEGRVVGCCVEGRGFADKRAHQPQPPATRPPSQAPSVCACVACVRQVGPFLHPSLRRRRIRRSAIRAGHSTAQGCRRLPPHLVLIPRGTARGRRCRLIELHVASRPPLAPDPVPARPAADPRRFGARAASWPTAPPCRGRHDALDCGAADVRAAAMDGRGDAGRPPGAAAPRDGGHVYARL